MVKKVLNTTISEDTPEKVVKKATELSDQVIYTPTTMQSRMKAKFWTKFQPGPMMGAEGVTMAKAMEVTGSAKIRTWWSQPGFAEWFLNRDEERERLKYLFNKSLDTMEQLLDNPEANANAKANIIKMLAEMNGYLTKRPVERFADEDINKMSEAQLKAFLERKGVKVVQEKIIDAEKTKSDD